MMMMMTPHIFTLNYHLLTPHIFTINYYYLLAYLMLYFYWPMEWHHSDWIQSCIRTQAKTNM